MCCKKITSKYMNMFGLEKSEAIIEKVMFELVCVISTLIKEKDSS